MHQDILGQSSISLTGRDFLTAPQDERVRSLCSRFYNKSLWKLGVPLFLSVHIKQYSPEGTAHKFSVRMLLTAGQVFEAAASDWDLLVAVHKTMNKLSGELEHRFHLSD